MKKILAFAASNNSKSINKQLVSYSLSQLNGMATQLIDLNDYEMPIFSIEREANSGIPQKAEAFKNAVREADGIIISFAEHNGSYSVAFKNVLDWCSRIEKSMWLDKPMLLMATSPGKRGGQTVLEAAASRFPHMGGKVIAQFSLPSFQQNFADTGIQNEELSNAHKTALEAFQESL